MATILCFQLFVFSVTAFAQNAEWRIISSTVNFKIKNAGFSVNGKFGPVKGKINFDRTSLTGNFIDVTIDAGLIDTDNKTRDKHLKKEDYFFIEKYPSIKMKATLFSKENDGTYKGFFKLTIKDQIKDVIVPFTFKEANGKANFTGSFQIDRLDYKVGSSSFLLSNAVLLNINVDVEKLGHVEKKGN